MVLYLRLTYFWRSAVKLCGSPIITKEKVDSVFVIPMYYHTNSSKIASYTYMLSCCVLLIFLLDLLSPAALFLG